jgi:hypothetical protein
MKAEGGSLTRKNFFSSLWGGKKKPHLPAGYQVIISVPPNQKNSPPPQTRTKNSLIVGHLRLCIASGRAEEELGILVAGQRLIDGRGKYGIYSGKA